MNHPKQRRIIVLQYDYYIRKNIIHDNMLLHERRLTEFIAPAIAESLNLHNIATYYAKPENLMKNSFNLN